MFDKGNVAAKSDRYPCYGKNCPFLQMPMLFSANTDNLYLAFFLTG